MIASKAGPKNAVAAPYTATRTMMCHSSSPPASESTARAPIATARTTSDSTITRRRSRRSLTAPPTSSRATWGTVIAMPTTAMAIGAFQMA